MGMDNTPQSYPMGAGYSTVAEIIECGTDTTGWQVGQRIAIPIPHQRLAAVPAARCHLLPDNLGQSTCHLFLPGSDRPAGHSQGPDRTGGRRGCARSRNRGVFWPCSGPASMEPCLH